MRACGGRFAETSREFAGAEERLGETGAPVDPAAELLAVRCLARGGMRLELDLSVDAVGDIAQPDRVALVTVLLDVVPDGGVGPGAPDPVRGDDGVHLVAPHRE